MSLDFNLTKINNYNEVCWLPENEHGDSYINPVTETLIFYTAFIKTWGITESNWRDMYKRIALWERLFSPTLKHYEFDEDGKVKSKRDRYITVEDVFQHIGLSTNGGEQTEAAYKKHVLKQFNDECDKEMNRFVKALNEFNELVTV